MARTSENGIERIIAKRTGSRKVYGYAVPCKEDTAPAPSQGVMPEALVAYGLIPELVGRLPVRVTLESPDQEMPTHDPH